jgi:tRNA 2-thiouridine synthesizing protein B
MALILVKYGIDNPAEKIKLKTSKDEDSIVLIQNGVFWALSDEINNVKGTLFAVKEDFIARGYDESECKVKLINYSEFVEVIEKEEKFIG